MLLTSALGLMALPSAVEILRIEIAKDPWGQTVKVPQPGSVEITAERQPILLRLKDTKTSVQEWYVFMGSIPIGAEAVDVEVGWAKFFMNYCGQISQEKDGTLGLTTHYPGRESSKDRRPAELDISDIPGTHRIDCFICQDGRTFFVNGNWENYNHLALSLRIPVLFKAAEANR